VKLTRASVREIIGDESEAHFQSRVIRLARLLGWKVFHLLDPIGSPAGFPDLLLRRPPRLVWAELKSEHGRVRPPQRAFLDELRACGQEAYTWRPSNWDQIKAVLGAS
jgi:hypothetical protein